MGSSSSVPVSAVLNELARTFEGLVNRSEVAYLRSRLKSDESEVNQMKEDYISMACRMFRDTWSFLCRNEP